MTGVAIVSDPSRSATSAVVPHGFRRAAPKEAPRWAARGLERELSRFREFGRSTLVGSSEFVVSGTGAPPTRIVPTFVNEFWTSRQRDSLSLHEVPYRACFKPQLPRFFIDRLSAPGDVVYDPFMGRGTTLLEAALAGRVPWGCDVNPLSRLLIAPRLDPPTPEDIARGLDALDLRWKGPLPRDLLSFYHPQTLREVLALREHLLRAERRPGGLGEVDAWIRLVAVNRLTGHSPGFLSVYTLPPNQAVSPRAQRRINAKRGQRPPRREVKPLLLRKSRSLLRDLTPELRRTLRRTSRRARLVTSTSEGTEALPDASVKLVVTSPPFLDVVDYPGDNWLRAWFCGVDLGPVAWTAPSAVPSWERAMTRTFQELRRLLVPGGHVAFEVGEVRRGSLLLEESVVRSGVASGLEPRLVLIHDQAFTKTSHCWGVSNGTKGTNSHRIVLFQKNA